MKNLNSMEFKIDGKFYNCDDKYFYLSPLDVKEIEPQNLNFRGFILCEGDFLALKDETPITVVIRKTNMTYKDHDKITERPIYYCKKFEINTDSVDLLYLSSNAFEGIGKKTASLILERFGTDLYSKVDDPHFIDELCEISRVTKAKAKVIIDGLKSNVKLKEVYNFLYNINPDDCTSLSEKLIHLYGVNDGLNKLKTNPYIVGYNIGLNFLECDKISTCAFNDKNRIEYLLKEAITRNENWGNTYNTLNTILYIASKIEEKTQREDKLFPEYLLPFVFKNKFISCIKKDDEIRCYSNEELSAEKSIARAIKAFEKRRTANGDIDMDVINSYQEDGIAFSDEQKRAFGALRTSGLKIILGKPGSGKTTIIKGFIHYINEKFPHASISLCAPTGNAAHRMERCTGHIASTIHKALGLSFENDTPKKMEDSFIIVDEMSMVDTFLFEKLLDSIPLSSTVILIGDINQIDSVGAGRVLKDLIQIENIETYRLETIFRQEKMSSIIINSDLINKGTTALIEDEKFNIIRYSNFNDVLDQIKDLYISNYDKEELYKIQILSGIKRKESGVYNLNHMFQSFFNNSKDYIVIDKRIFRIDDKVIFERNNYEDGYTNGTLGYIKSIDNREIHVQTEERMVIVNRENIRDLSLAYATTIHKSQGSEYDDCIIILSKESSVLLKRNLLYTAVTRAKGRVFIFSEGDALEMCIANNKSNERKTSVLDFYNEI